VGAGANGRDSTSSSPDESCKEVNFATGFVATFEPSTDVNDFLLAVAVAFAFTDADFFAAGKLLRLPAGVSSKAVKEAPPREGGGLSRPRTGRGVSGIGVMGVCKLRGNIVLFV